MGGGNRTDRGNRMDPDLDMSIDFNNFPKVRRVDLTTSYGGIIDDNLSDDNITREYLTPKKETPNL